MSRKKGECLQNACTQMMVRGQERESRWTRVVSTSVRQWQPPDRRRICKVATPSASKHDVDEQRNLSPVFLAVMEGDEAETTTYNRDRRRTELPALINDMINIMYEIALRCCYPRFVYVDRLLGTEVLLRV